MNMKTLKMKTIIIANKISKTKTIHKAKIMKMKMKMNI